MAQPDKLAVIDKDGTLVETISLDTFVQSPTDQKLIAGVQDAIANLVDKGYALAIASNQAGIAAGHKSLQDTIAEMRYAMQLTGIQTAYFCPDFDGYHCYKVTPDLCEGFNDKPMPSESADRHPVLLPASGFGWYRKPDAGMLKMAIADHNVNEAIMIGDRSEDEQAAANAQIPFVLAKDWRLGVIGETSKEKTAKVAAQWWASQIGSPYFITGDPIADAMGSRANLEIAKHLNAEDAKRFEAELSKLLVDRGSGHGGHIGSISVDYDPDSTLTDAIAKASIDPSMIALPVKTIMWINWRTGEVSARLGRGAPVVSVQKSLLAI